MLTCAELFTQYLKEKNFNYQTHEFDDGDIMIDFPYQGKTVKLVFSGEDGKYLSLYLNYEKVPEEKFVDLLVICNELNAKYKWATFYIDDDRDILIHDDAILSVETAADETFELLVRIIRIGDDVKPVIMKGIYA